MNSPRGRNRLRLAVPLALVASLCVCLQALAQDEASLIRRAAAAKAAHDYDTSLRLLAGAKGPDALWLKAWVFAVQARRPEAAEAFTAFIVATKPDDDRLPEAKAALGRLIVAASPPAPMAAQPRTETSPPVPPTPAPEPMRPQHPAPPAPAGPQPRAEPVAVEPLPAAQPLAPPPPPPVSPQDARYIQLQEFIYNAPVKGVPEPLGGGIMVKFKVRLEDGSEKGYKTVFKPRQKSPQSFTYEIAAYRIDRLCRIGHVPVTVKRALPRDLLARAGASGFGRVISSGDLVGGSLQQWINDAKDPFGMKARAWAEGWLVRLERMDTRLPDISLARQASNLFLLDYLQGNQDRYSGGNLLQDRDGKIWFIDNSEAFSSSTRPRRDFDRLKRFDRETIEALRQATVEDFTREVGPWITQSELKGLLERRLHVLERVDAVVEKYGAKKAYL